MGLRLYNTLSRKVEDFRPLEEGRVKIFVCGTTEQDFVHLGHGRTYAFYDTLVRFLKHLGYDVFYIQNITDVGHLTDDADQGEDKILLSARKEGKHPMEIVDYFIKEHLEAADKLRLARPNIMPRATGHLPEIIEQVRTLLEKGYAYEVNGSVYYDISKFEDYGKLSRVNVEEMLSGARVDVREEKRNPRDFALWINAPRGHVLRWPSPWGEGYPGWHIEDTAIAIKYFGPQYDIHGGAIELVFPHHEAEIAQAEATTGVKPYVRYWVHTGLLTIMGEKMAKSKGNYIKLIDALEQYGAEALRLWMASAHYRQPVDYSEEALQAAQKNIKKISQTLRRITQSLEDAPREKSVFAEEVKELEKRFMDAMMDDMNTPKALSLFFELLSTVNKNVDSETYSRENLEIAGATIRRLGDFFQIIPEEKPGTELMESLVEMILQLREEARRNRDWENSDKIRKKLRELGIDVEDTPGGASWEIANR